MHCFAYQILLIDIYFVYYIIFLITNVFSFKSLSACSFYLHDFARVIWCYNVCLCKGYFQCISLLPVLHISLHGLPGSVIIILHCSLFLHISARVAWYIMIECVVLQGLIFFVLNTYFFTTINSDRLLDIKYSSW